MLTFEAPDVFESLGIKALFRPRDWQGLSKTSTLSVPRLLVFTGSFSLLPRIPFQLWKHTHRDHPEYLHLIRRDEMAANRS